MSEKHYKFGEFCLDTNSRNLLHREQTIRLSPRAFDILLFLICRQGRVVTKDQIIENVWTDSFVEENNIAVHISAIRRVLGERVYNTKHIETISGRGYCFLTPVTEINSSVFSLLAAHQPEPSEIRSIAVLPFSIEKTDERSRFLSDGITDSLINSLSQLSELKVISYSAVSGYRYRESNLRDVGFLLGVDSLLIGNIIEIDEDLEIRVELVRVCDLSRIWGTQYQCKLANLFKTKAEISVAIAEKLKIRLTKSETTRLVKQPTENSEAYQFYLKGRRLAETHSKQGLLKAINLFGEALKLDPEFALAHAYTGYAHTILALSFYVAPSEAVPKAEAAIESALAIDSKLSDAHAVRGFLLLYRLDLKQSEKSFKRAIELNPNNGFAHAHYGLYLLACGDFDVALNHHSKSIELSPNTLSFAALSTKLMMMGEYQKSIDNWESSSELFHNHSFAFFGLAFSYAHLGNYHVALKHVESALRIVRSTENLALAAYIYSLSGDRKKARVILKLLIENYDDAPVDFYDIAVIFDSLRDNENALVYLEKAIESKFSHIYYLLIDPRIVSVREDPRFNHFLRRLGFDGRSLI